MFVLMGNIFLKIPPERRKKMLEEVYKYHQGGNLKMRPQEGRRGEQMLYNVTHSERWRSSGMEW